MDSQFQYLFKLVIIGDTGVGKSAMMKRYVENSWTSEYLTTIGVDFGSKILDTSYDNKKARIKIQIWDTAGQETFRSITQNYYTSAAGALIVYDVTSRESFDNLSRWLDDVRKYCPLETSIVIVGNKSDRENIRKVSTEEGKEFADRHNVLFMEGNAKNNNIHPETSSRAFQMVADDVYRKLCLDRVQSDDKNGIRSWGSPPEVAGGFKLERGDPMYQTCCIIL